MSKWGRSHRETGILRKHETYPEQKIEDLLVFGYSCKIFHDDEKALEIDQGKHLIPWMGDESLKIDRYDCRGHLSDLRIYEANSGIYDSKLWLDALTESERKVELLCDEERYRSLHINEEEEELYREEELKRLHLQLSREKSYQQVGFNYNEDSTKKENDDKDQNEKDKASIKEEEFYVAPPDLDLPINIAVPKTMKEHARIEKTAMFISKQGMQMEILLKTKQSGNPQFDFLSHDNPLFNYYRHILMAIKTGRYRSYVDESKPNETKVENEETTDQTDDSDNYLHPSLAVGPAKVESAPSIPNIAYKPSANCAYTMLISKIKGKQLQKQKEVTLSIINPTDTLSNSTLQNKEMIVANSQSNKAKDININHNLVSQTIQQNPISNIINQDVISNPQNVIPNAIQQNTIQSNIIQNAIQPNNVITVQQNIIPTTTVQQQVIPNSIQQNEQNNSKYSLLNVQNVSTTNLEPIVENKIQTDSTYVYNYNTQKYETYSQENPSIIPQTNFSIPPPPNFSIPPPAPRPNIYLPSTSGLISNNIIYPPPPPPPPVIQNSVENVGNQPIAAFSLSNNQALSQQSSIDNNLLASYESEFVKDSKPKPLLPIAHYSSDSDSDLDKENENETKVIINPPSYELPHLEFQIIIDKMASYVVRNGKDFESIVRAKGDPRFKFLDEGHVYNNYYKHKLRIYGGSNFLKQKENDKLETKENANDKGGNNDKKSESIKQNLGPVSFSIKKPKESEIVAPIIEKSALPIDEESSSDDENAKQLEDVKKSTENSKQINENVENRQQQQQIECSKMNENKIIEICDESDLTIDLTLDEKNVDKKFEDNSTLEKFRKKDKLELQKERKLRAAAFLNQIKIKPVEKKGEVHYKKTDFIDMFEDPDSPKNSKYTIEKDNIIKKILEEQPILNEKNSLKNKDKNRKRSLSYSSDNSLNYDSDNYNKKRSKTSYKKDDKVKKKKSHKSHKRKHSKKHKRHKYDDVEIIEDSPIKDSRLDKCSKDKYKRTRDASMERYKSPDSTKLKYSKKHRKRSKSKSPRESKSSSFHKSRSHSKKLKSRSTSQKRSNSKTPPKNENEFYERSINILDKLIKKSHTPPPKNHRSSKLKTKNRKKGTHSEEKSSGEVTDSDTSSEPS